MTWQARIELVGGARRVLLNTAHGPFDPAQAAREVSGCDGGQVGGTEGYPDSWNAQGPLGGPPFRGVHFNGGRVDRTPRLSYFNNARKRWQALRSSSDQPLVPSAPQARPPQTGLGGEA